MPMYLEGPAGVIECQWTECQGAKVAALICHPHPLYGGSMDDAVVGTISEAMQRHHVSSLRFNFRGVGGSAGRHDGGEGEMADVNFLLSWLSTEIGATRIYLAGYSFGAMVALNATCASQIPIGHLFLIAPPIGYQQSPEVVPCAVTTIVGDQDQVIDHDELTRWVRSAGIEQDFHVLIGADHFFNGFHPELGGLMDKRLAQLESDMGAKA